MNRVPDACALPINERPARLAEFDDLLHLTVRPPERTDRLSLRLHLPNDDATREQVRDLITRENACCTFFAFDLRAVDGVTGSTSAFHPARSP